MELEYNITYRQKDKGWQFIISYKLNGKWKQKSKQGFKTKKDAKPIAEKMLLLIKKEINNSSSIVNVDYNNISFSTLFEKFYEHMSLYREQATLENYQSSYSCFKLLHNMKVADIKKIHLQNCVDLLMKENKKASSINVYINRIKLIFDYYINNYDSSYINPSCKLEYGKTAKATKKALTKNEIDLMLKEFKNSQYYSFILLCVTCGLRRGEALGLTWNDIDEVNMCITINKQWKKLKNGTKGFGETKNKKHRIVPLPGNTLKELKEFKNSHPTDINNRVCIYCGEYLSTHINPILKKYGITIHELRHTYVTNLIAAGIDFKTVAALIGDTVEMVIQTYSHMTDDMMKKACNIIENIF